MTSPPAGAGTLRVTVPVAILPPRTTGGLTVSPVSAAARTVSEALCDWLPNAAVIFTTVSTAGAWVVTGNVVDTTFPDAVTWGGTAAMVGWSLDSVITTPPGGAAPLSVTRPCTVTPPETVSGASVSGCSTGGSRCSGAETEMPPKAAVTSTSVGTATEAAVTPRLPRVAPTTTCWFAANVTNS